MKNLAILALSFYLGLITSLSCWAEDSLGVSFSPIASGLDKPTYMIEAPDNSSRLFIAEKSGKIRILKDGSVSSRSYLDLSELVSSGKEQGLLSIAFPPNFKTSKVFYTSYTDLQGDTVVAQFKEDSPTSAEIDTMKVVLKIVQPDAMNNGGLIAFGPDGYLYVGAGDGGGKNDPENYAQNMDSMLGKILRINVKDDAKYESPPDNPFIGKKDILEEIWAIGFKNPNRFSFDLTNKRLLVTDIEQNGLSELNVISKGLNYGWNIVEGNNCLKPGCKLSNFTAPMTTISNETGTEIVGGFVYRGKSIPEVLGYYFFGDQSKGKIWILRENNSNWEQHEIATLKDKILSFAEDLSGELYVLTSSGSVLKMQRK